MGSVLDIKECPNCKYSECHTECFYRSGELYEFCPKCGYSYKNFIKRDEEGNWIMKDKSKGHVFDNFEREEILVANPYGTYTIIHENGISSLGTLKSEDEYLEFTTQIQSLDFASKKIVRVELGRYNEGNFSLEIINL